MPRNMVIGKLKYLIGPGEWNDLCTLLVEVGFIFLSRRTGAETSGSVVGEGAPDPQTGKKREL